MNVFNIINLKKSVSKTQSLFKKLEYRFLVINTKIDNTTFPYQTAMWKKKEEKRKKKVKSLHRYCPVATGTALSPTFILDAKVKNSIFWKISYSRTFSNWVALHMNLKNEWDFSNIKNFRKCKMKESGPSYKWNFMFSDNLGQKLGDKLTKLSEIGFAMECFTSEIFVIFSQKCQNLAFGLRARFSLSNPSISGISMKFPNFLRS